MITFSPVKVTVIQSAAMLLFSAVTFLLMGKVSAYSLLLGGLISVIPTAYFGYMVFRYSGARAIEKIVQSAYLGEAGKLVLMGAGFALVFKLIEPLAALGVFAGFILTHSTGLATTVWMQRTS